MTISEPPSYDLYQIAEAGFSTNNYIYLGIIVLLLLVSAMMSGSESAFFSLRPLDREEIKQENSAKSKLISDLLAKPKELLATILITNNFVNVGVVILSTFILNDFYPPTKHFEIKRFLLEVLGITFILLMTGEVIPKIFAAKNSLRVVRWMVYPLNILRKTPPLSWLKNLLVKGSFFIQKNAKGKTSITTDELEQAIALTKEDNDSEDDHKILEGIVKFGRTEACQIMTPRIEVDAIDIASNFKDVLAFILEAGYSRIPVFQDTQDNVVGILYINGRNKIHPLLHGGGQERNMRAGTENVYGIIGFAKASAIMMTGEKISAPDAERWGMIYKCVADDQFEETITRLAQEVSLMPTHALGLTKAALNASMSNTLDQQLQLEEQYQIEAGGTNDYSEGVTAFMEKRKAIFIGR